MAVKGVTLVERTSYTLESDTVNPTVWYLGPIDTAVRAMITDQNVQYTQDENGAQVMKLLSGSTAVLACRFGLVDWENFADEQGEPIIPEFTDRTVSLKSYRVLTDKVLSKIPAFAIAELGGKIMRLNQVTAEDQKKSKTP